MFKQTFKKKTFKQKRFSIFFLSNFIDFQKNCHFCNSIYNLPCGTDPSNNFQLKWIGRRGDRKISKDCIYSQYAERPLGRSSSRQIDHFVAKIKQ